MWERIKKALVPLGVVGLLLLKWLAKLKLLILPVLKFLPVLVKTGGSMFLMIWLYAMRGGWWFAAGFVRSRFLHLADPTGRT